MDVQGGQSKFVLNNMALQPEPPLNPLTSGLLATSSTAPKPPVLATASWDSTQNLGYIAPQHSGTMLQSWFGPSNPCFDQSQWQPAVERPAASVAASRLINSWGEAAGKSVVAKLIQSCVESYPAASSSTSSNHVLINPELFPPQHTQGTKWSDQSAQLIAQYTASRSIGAASLASPVDAIGRRAAERSATGVHQSNGTTPQFDLTCPPSCKRNGTPASNCKPSKRPRVEWSRVPDEQSVPDATSAAFAPIAPTAGMMVANPELWGDNLRDGRRYKHDAPGEKEGKQHQQHSESAGSPHTKDRTLLRPAPDKPKASGSRLSQFKAKLQVFQNSQTNRTAETEHTSTLYADAD